jgi:hypothetical protein
VAIAGGTRMAMQPERRYIVLTLFVALLRMFVAAHTPGDATFIRTDVADGSVWANVWETHHGTAMLKSSVRLRDADARLRWVPVDIDGDGRLDLVAFTIGGRHLEVWRGHADGFTRVE